MSNIQTELMKITKVKKEPKDRQAFLALLLEQADKLPDDAWEELGPGSQKWINGAIKAKKAGKDLPDFPDIEAVEEEEEEDEEEESTPKKAKVKAKAAAVEEEDEAEEEDEGEEEEEEEEAPVVKAKAKTKPLSKAKKEAAARQERAKANGAKVTVKKAAGIGSGAPTVIKQMIIKKPDITKEELIDKLKAKGLKVTPLTVATQRSYFRHSIRVLQDAGMLKKNLVT